MKYNFTDLAERKSTHELKWECPEGVLPMWIADMDYTVAPEIQKAIEERAAKGSFGYTEPDEGWYQAYQDFYKDRHGLTIEKDWLTFSLGVVPTISSTVRKLTEVGEKVVVLTPVYNIFFNSIVNNKRVPFEVPLVYSEGRYDIDFPALEQAFKDPKTTLMIFCNPHNPVSRLWRKEEMDRIGRLAKENHVTVLSDEIHGEITRPGRSYLPFIQANDSNQEITVTAVSVTKAFSLPGIQTSAIITPNPELRKKVVRQLNTDECAEPNSFSCVVAEAALNEGRGWLDAMRKTVFSHRDLFEEYLKKHLPSLRLVNGDATYLLWIDVSSVASSGKAFADFLLKKEKLWVQEGSVYGKGGASFIRVNVATSKENVLEALRRLTDGVRTYKETK